MLFLSACWWFVVYIAIFLKSHGFSTEDYERLEEKGVNLCSIPSSEGDDWLEGKCTPDDKSDGKWTFSGFDMMSTNAPIDHRCRYPAQNPGRCGWHRQAAEGHSLLSHYCPFTLPIIPSELQLLFLTWWTDDNHPCSIVPLRLLVSGTRLFCFCHFCLKMKLYAGSSGFYNILNLNALLAKWWLISGFGLIIGFIAWVSQWRYVCQ